jgi:hypothetical protein
MQEHYAGAKDWDQNELDHWYVLHSGPGYDKPAALDEWDQDKFGDKAAYTGPTAAPTPSFDKTKTPSTEQFQTWGLEAENADYLSKQSPTKFWQNVATAQKYVDQDPDHYDVGSTWYNILKGLAASAAAPTGGPPPAYDGSALFDELEQAHPGHFAENWFQQASPEQAEKALKGQIASGTHTAAQKAKLQAVYDKWFPGGTPQAAAPTGKAPATPMPTVEDLMGMGLGIGAGTAQNLVSQGPEKFQSNLDYVKAQGPKQFPPNSVWGKILQWTQEHQGQGVAPVPAGPAPPPPNPPFDWGEFAPEFKAIYPQSSWADQDDPGTKTPVSQLETNLTTSLTSKEHPEWATSEKTQQAQALFKKWFPQEYAAFMSNLQAGGKAAPAPVEPDIEEIKAIQENLPEPEPAKPFKSQQPDPADIEHWAANQPQTETGWKQFSTWWGNNQLTPEQETGIYNTWFGQAGHGPATEEQIADWMAHGGPYPQGPPQGAAKEVTPEKANAWFGAMFDQYSEPSNADLGLDQKPHWANAPWALGTKADQEWPVFQQWATKHPGIPKNTSIKQKLAIWNGLSTKEKADIADEYLPTEALDTKAAVDALKAAYPDSDWSKWSTMSQSALKKNVQNLAESGYAKAIPVFNEYFGGNIPMPAEETGEEAPEVPQVSPAKIPPSIPQVPPEGMPNWAKASYKFGQGAAGARDYSTFLHFANSIGLEGADSNDQYTAGNAYQKWRKIPYYIRNQLEHMPQLPWQDEAGFQAWMGSQPTPKDLIQQITGEKLDSGYWGEGYDYAPDSHGPGKAKSLEEMIQAESDPTKKIALTGVYHQFFPNANQSTLAEDLQAFDPKPSGIKNFTNWDSYLKTASPDEVEKLIKKKLKTETDPEKWIQYVDTWSKYFSANGATSGSAKVNKALGKNNGNFGTPASPPALKSLHYWKTQQGGDSQQKLTDAYYLGDYQHGSPFLTKKEQLREKGNFPSYLGWTPPSGGGQGYKADPAMMGTLGQPTTYTAPPEAATKSKVYQELVTHAAQWEPEPFKPADFTKKFEEALPQLVKFHQDHPDAPVGIVGNPNPTPHQARSELDHVLRHYPDLPFWQRQRLEELGEKYFSDTGFSAQDKHTLNSSAFQHWFNRATPDYQEVMKLQPGLAIDDFENFLAGGPSYSPVPEGTGKKVLYDFTKEHFYPSTKPGDRHTVYFPDGRKIHVEPNEFFESTNPKPDLWPGFTKNPPRPGQKDIVQRPEMRMGEPGQLEFVLPPGESWVNPRKPVELHRGIHLNLDFHDQNPPVAPEKALEKSNPPQYDKELKEYHKHLHRKYLSDLVKARLLGSAAAPEAIPDLFNTYQESGGEQVEVPQKWKSNAPYSVKDVFDFHKWAKDNDVPPEQMYSLAKKWGVDEPGKYGTPPLSEGPGAGPMKGELSWNSDPAFANLILDLLSASDYRGSQGYAPPGSIGDHWSLNKGTAHNFGGGSSGENPFNVEVVADWDGRGVWRDDPFAVYDLSSSEQEIPLSPGSPVFVKRVRIDKPDKPDWNGNTWHDLNVNAHYRYARLRAPRSIQAVQVHPSQLYDLALSWGIPHPERYGSPPAHHPERLGL